MSLFLARNPASAVNLRHTRMPVLLLLGALAGWAMGCSDNSAVPEPVVSVETATAKLQPMVETVTAEGVLYPIHQASLSPKVTAPVRNFFVNRGDRVHKGQLLAQLENRDLAAAVVSAEGNYDQAKATYATATGSVLPETVQKAQLDLKDAEATLKVQEQLYAAEENLYRQGAIARRQLDQTDVALTTARSAYETAQKHMENLQRSGATEQQQAAKGQLEIAQGQYQAATAQLQYAELRSPIDGVIADRAVYPGDMAPAGTPLLVVMDTSSVVARVHIPQEQAAQLKLGDLATLQAPGLPESAPGKVTVISPALDPNSTTVEIWVEAHNPDGKLQPGTSVQVSVAARHIPQALVIPAGALLTDQDGESVMVAAPDGRAYSHKVTTGIHQGGLVQVLSGLKPGDQVIVGGAYGLPNKTKIKIRPATADQAGLSPSLGLSAKPLLPAAGEVRPL